MAGWFELNVNDSGQYSFVLKAANGQVILRSQQYASRAGAEGGIASVQNNASNAALFELLTASDGSPYFNLKAGNGQIIGTSQMYSSEAARSVGIESVRSNGSSAEIRS
jgi:hypothetical protein